MDSCKSKIVTIEVSVHGLSDGCTQVPLPDPRGSIEVPLPDQPAADLHRYFALRGPNGKYLGYVRDHPCPGFLSFRFDDLASPCVKHEVVKAENGEAHVKCCYNDMFWRKNSPQEEWIVAAADSPNAHRSSWASTLFRASISQSHAGKISLSSLQGNGNGKQLDVLEGRAFKNNVEIDGCLFARGEAKGRQDAVAFEAVSLVKFPPYVAFKGDNNKFLACFLNHGYNSLIFNSDDIGDNLVRHRVDEMGGSEGRVWIKNLYWNQYWRVQPNNRWIIADTYNNSANDLSIQFLPVQVDGNTVALRCCQGAREFSNRYTDDKNKPCLRAYALSLDNSALFKVVESVKMRRVTSIVYDMSTAHIYDLQPLVLATSAATNTTNQPAMLEMFFSYTDKKSQSWSSSMSFTTGISFEFSAGVPLVAGTTVTLSTEISATTEWGKSFEEETNVSSTYGVNIDPGERVKVDLVASQGKCNVRFSYTQEDLLTSGERVRYNRTDGVFKGINYTDIQYVAKVVKPTLKTIISSL